MVPATLASNGGGGKSGDGADGDGDAADADEQVRKPPSSLPPIERGQSMHVVSRTLLQPRVAQTFTQGGFMHRVDVFLLLHMLRPRPLMGQLGQPIWGLSLEPARCVLLHDKTNSSVCGALKSVLSACRILPFWGVAGAKVSPAPMTSPTLSKKGKRTSGVPRRLGNSVAIR